MSDSFPIGHFFSSNTPNKNNNLEEKPYNLAWNESSRKAENEQRGASGASDNFLTQNQLSEPNDQEEQELRSITHEVRLLLKESVQENKYKTYFENTFTVSSMDQDSINFSVTTPFIKKTIENFYILALQKAVSDLLGTSFKIKIDVMNSGASTSTLALGSGSSETTSIFEESFQEGGFPNRKGGSKNSVKTTSFKIGSFTPTKEELMDGVKSEVRKTLTSNFGNKIDDKKTFDNFIVGPSNNFAHAFCVAVAKEPGTVYPQLYIHGNSGLGKTHLLHAICNHIKSHHPKYRICLTTATDFMSEMVMAIQSNKTGVDRFAEFRRKYTDMVDVLIIDDIHELAGKTRTQSEFFYVFNELQVKKKQLIFTSDKAPKEIKGLEDRIRTRLNSTLLVDIQQPDLETRIAILKKKAFEKDIFLDDEVINLIASSVKSNVRELEGKLVKLGAYSDLMNVDIDLEIAKQQLNLEQAHNEKVIEIDDIANAVANYLAIPLGDIRGKTRKKEVALGRHIAMYMSHKRLKMTLEEIGEYFEKRDHSTVIHGIRKIEDMVKKDSRVSQQIYEIESSL